MQTTMNETDDGLRDRALQQLKKKRDFKGHLLAYVLVNALFVGIWAVTGASFFWPVFPIMGWGIGVAFNAWDVYVRQDPTEKEIQREIDALRRKER